MTFQEKCKLVRIHSAIDEAMGDTDLDGDLTDSELREEDPLLWAAQEIAKLIGPGPWDKYCGDHRRAPHEGVQDEAL